MGRGRQEVTVAGTGLLDPGSATDRPGYHGVVSRPTWTVTGHGRARVTAFLVGIAALVCVLVSHSPAMAPAAAMPTMVVTSVLDGGAAEGHPGAAMACGGMGGSGASHACLSAVNLLLVVAFALVLAIVVTGRPRRGGPASGPGARGPAARGAPPWTVLSRSQLSVIRV